MEDSTPKPLGVNLGDLEDEEENPFDEDFDEADLEQASDSNQEVDGDAQQQFKEPKRRKKVKKNPQSEEDSSNFDDLFDDNDVIDKLPLEKGRLQDMLLTTQAKIRQYRAKFFGEQIELKAKKSQVGDNSVPICTDVTKFDFDRLISKQLEVADRQFDVLMMDPPWRLSSSSPSRGVAIQYLSLSDELIEQIPVAKLQSRGFLFVWVINAKFQWTVNTMERKWGYKVIDSINWVKKTVNDKIAKGHGFYLQHAKETCLVGYKKGEEESNTKKFDYQRNVASDVIFSDRRGQSQKPTQIYEYIQQLVPNGYYLQIFGRRNNLRDRWVTIGNEL